MISYSAENFLTFSPYNELYEQYGLLSDFLTHFFYRRFEFRLALGVFYSIIFFINCSLIFYLANKITSRVFAVVILITYILISPRIQYPWPDYLAATGILAFIVFVTSKKTPLNSFLAALMICLALFAREILIVYLLSLLSMLLISNYFFKNVFWRHIKLIFFGIFIHYCILFAYLIYNKAINYYLIQTFNLSFWQDTSQPIAERFLTRFISLSLGANLAVHAFQILIFISTIFFVFSINKIKKKINFQSTSVLLLTFFSGFSGILMSLHIPDLYRYQIYSFPTFFISFNYLINEISAFKRIRIFLFVLPALIFFIIGIKNNYRDAAGESITLFNKSTSNFYGFYFNDEQINFYKNIRLKLNHYNFVNKTPDPLIERLFPESKFTAALPFYSLDFIRRLPTGNSLKKYDYELKIIDNEIDCKFLAEMPAGVSFFSGSKYYLCRIDNYAK